MLCTAHNNITVIYTGSKKSVRIILPQLIEKIHAEMCCSFGTIFQNNCIFYIQQRADDGHSVRRHRKISYQSHNHFSSI